MINLTGISSVEQAISYYEADDYYSEGEESPSRWLGAGAEALGLSGQVDREIFADLLRGELPNGQQLGQRTGDQVRHYPGHDLTISACKSVSIGALVTGDEMLTQAHRQAVEEAMGYVQERAVTRIRNGEGGIDRQRTGSLTIAAFDHATSRNLDPQLHTHCVILNATQDKYSGEWRSLDAREFYKIQRTVNEVYQQNLAKKVLALGYEIEQSKDGFELKNFGEQERAAFSGRKQAIDAWLHENGYNRETATADIRERASLATRPSKDASADREQLRENWRQRADEIGMNLERQDNAAPPTREEIQEAAAASVMRAAEHLAERNSRFSSDELEQASIREARATCADLQAVRTAVEKAQAARDLVPRQVQTSEGEQLGWTTRQAIKNEQTMLGIEEYSRNSVSSMLNEKQAAEAVKFAEKDSQYPWTAGQKIATEAILNSTNKIQAVQGYAGTAKTTSVLRTVSAEAQALGYEVKGMAPTHAAAQQLQEGAGLSDSSTVQAHVLEQRRESGASEKPQLWLIDEASLMSAADTLALLRAAEKAKARLLLVGDVQQLGSVESGEAFRQLQEGGMETHILDGIVRQQNSDTKSAVYQAIAGDAQAAMESIKRSGQIIEGAEKGGRIEQMASDYLSLSPAERRETLVIDPTRAGRAELNEKIRQGLKEEGTLSQVEISANALEKRDLTAAQATDASRYQAGDILRFGKKLKSAGIEAGQYYKIVSIDLASGTLQLQPENGGEPLEWQPRRGGARQVEIFQEDALNLSQGDRIQWTKNDKNQGLVNGQNLTVQAVSGSLVKALDERGKTHLIDTNQRDSQHFRHAYATTVHASQGRTAGRVICHLAEDHRDLISQRSFYVSISRTKNEIRLHTDDAAALAQNIERNSGQQQTALDMTVVKNQGQEREAAREHGRGR